VANGLSQWEFVEPGLDRETSTRVTVQYVRGLFDETDPEGEVTVDRPGDDDDQLTRVFLWSLDSSKTAREMARIVDEDVKELRKEIPRQRSKPKRP
jgi:hypothetical protein